MCSPILEKAPAAAEVSDERASKFQQLGHALAVNNLSVERMQCFFADNHGLKVEADLERRYTPADEIEYIINNPSCLEDIKKARGYEHLKLVALSRGLYYLFKYLYIVAKVPLTLTEYNTYFPKTALHSSGPSDPDSTIIGTHTKVTLDMSGTAVIRQQRISVFMDEIKTKSSYANGSYNTGARWVFKKF